MWFVVWNNSSILVKGICIAYIKERLIWYAMVCTKNSHCDMELCSLYVRETMLRYRKITMWKEHICLSIEIAVYYMYEDITIVLYMLVELLGWNS